MVERYAYTPYGEVTVLNPDFSAVTGNASAISNELLYTGRRLDPETGLQLNRNRFYHQQLGRWVNRDPIGYEGGTLNLYEYVNGKPTIGLDPNGLKKGFGNQGRWSITTKNGRSYSGKTAFRLRAAMVSIKVNGDTVSIMILKGHADSAGVYDDNGTPYFLMSGGWISTNNQASTGLWRAITNNTSTINLRGCHTAPAALDGSKVISSKICGSGTYVLGFPFTTGTVGSYTCFQGGSRK